MVIGNSEGSGLLTAKMYNGQYKAKLEIPGGIKEISKQPSMGEVWIFSGATLYYNHVIILKVINNEWVS